MSTTRETVLAALRDRLQPLSVLILRDEVLPERIPTAGLIILRDGQPRRAGSDANALALLLPAVAEVVGAVGCQSGNHCVDLGLGGNESVQRGVDGLGHDGSRVGFEDMTAWLSRYRKLFSDRISGFHRGDPQNRNDCPMLAKALLDILEPAYQPCAHFAGACAGACVWEPSRGLVPCAFGGATGTLDEVRLIIVTAEPGDPPDSTGYMGHVKGHGPQLAAHFSRSDA